MSQNTTTTEPRVIAFNYVLKNDKGETLDASEPNQPLPFLEGRQQIIPALERIIAMMNEGDKKEVKLTAEEAYGEVRPDMVMEVPKEELAHLNVKRGSQLQLQLEKQVKVVTVTKMTDTMITLDGNHPLAGVALTFDVEVMLIRPATKDELTHGHAHGLHGHAHHH